MTPSEKLRLAIRYVVEARGEVDEAAENADPYVRTARRQSLKANLEAARELLAVLERDHPGVTTLHTFDDGVEEAATVPQVRVWLYHIEADVMARCYADFAAARQIIERVIAINPDSARDHACLAWMCAELKDFAAATAAVERAISLDPDEIEYKRGLNDIRREAERVAAEAAAASKPSKWNPKSWLG